MRYCCFVCECKAFDEIYLDPINEVDINNIGKAEIYDELKPFFARIANQNAEKEKTEKIRREFTANVSHELKNTAYNHFGICTNDKQRYGKGGGHQGVWQKDRKKSPTDFLLL